jgi:hypothetical protein
MTTPPDSQSHLRDLARHYSNEAHEARAEAVTYARRHRTLHVCVGLSAVCFGAAAGSLGALHLPALSALAGVLAAIAAGAQGFLKAPVLARFHFERAAAYGALARQFDLLAIGPAEPSQDELQDLIERWRQVEARSLDDVDPFSSNQDETQET